MLKLSQENKIIDLPDLNRFRIGDEVIVDANADYDRFEGVIIGIELRRLHGSSYLVPSITILHDGCITDEFKPIDCREVDPQPPAPTLMLAIAAVLDADKDFREQMPAGWDGDPLTDAIDGLRATLAAPSPAQKLRVTGFRGNPLRVVLSSGQEATLTQKFIDAFASPSPFDRDEAIEDPVIVPRGLLGAASCAIKRKLDAPETLRLLRFYSFGRPEDAPTAASPEDEFTCPVCLVSLKPDDICATDIELGICHAECLEGSPVVDFDTSELIPGGEVDTYRFGDTDPAPTASEVVSS